MREDERGSLLRAADDASLRLDVASEGEGREHQSRGTNARRTIGALSGALVASLALNGAQYARGKGWTSSEAALGSSRFALAAPRGLTRDAHLDACGHASKFSLMCVGEREERGAWRSIAMLGQEPMQQFGQEMAADAAAMAQSGAVDLAAATPHAQVPASGATRYCRKDTWLLSCLFYKANINDEATDWKHVKEECDGEFECDGVNKYWTSDLWHIGSSGNANGCDASLADGAGTDASAFYKEGSAGWRQYGPDGGDGSCKVVNSWGNPESHRAHALSSRCKNHSHTFFTRARRAFDELTRAFDASLTKFRRYFYYSGVASPRLASPRPRAQLFCENVCEHFGHS